MAIMAVVVSFTVVVPRLRADPVRYLATDAASYVRTRTRGGQEVSREIVSAAQLSSETWARDTGMAAGAVASFALLALVPLLHRFPRAGVAGVRGVDLVRRHLLGRGGHDKPANAFEGNACEVWAEPRCDIVAPVWCVSLLFVTSRRYGAPRRLCPKHARSNAASAVAVCGLFGWWGIPWGPIWTVRPFATTCLRAE
jgi:hypothetical protein